MLPLQTKTMTLFNWHRKSSIPDEVDILFVTTKNSDETDFKIMVKNSTCWKTVDEVVKYRFTIIC